MDLVRLLNSLDGTFSGTLDDTLLNRLASGLLCSNTACHADFWTEFDATSSSIEPPGLFDQVARHLLSCLRGGSLAHPNLIKIYLSLINRRCYYSGDPTAGQLSSHLRDIISVGLRISTCPVIQHVVLECCLILTSSTDNGGLLPNLLWEIVDDSVLLDLINFSTITNSLFSRQCCLKVSADILRICQSDLQERYPRSISRLSAMCEGALTPTTSRTLGLEMLAAYCESCRLNGAQCNLSPLFSQSKLLSSFLTTAPNTEVHFILFYILCVSKSDEAAVEAFVSHLSTLGAECRLTLALRLIRRAKCAGITVNLASDVGVKELSNSLEVALCQALDQSQARQFNRLMSSLGRRCHLGQILSSDTVEHCRQSVLNGVRNANEADCPFWPLLVQLPWPDAAELLRTLEALLLTWEAAANPVLAFCRLLRGMFEEFWRRRRDAYSPREITRIGAELFGKWERLSRSTESWLKSPEFAFCYTGLIRELFAPGSSDKEALNREETEALTASIRISTLVDCQKAFLEAQQASDDLLLLPCCYFDASLSICHHLLFVRREEVEDQLDLFTGGGDFSPALFAMSDTVAAEESSCLPDEFREKLLAMLIYSIFLCPVPRGEHVARRCCQLAAHPFEHRCIALTQCLAQCATKLRTAEQAHLVLSVLAEALDRQVLLVGEYFPRAAFDCLAEADTISSGHPQREHVIRQLSGLLDAGQVCPDCGETLENLVSDILIAQERPTDVDCVGD